MEEPRIRLKGDEQRLINAFNLLRKEGFRMFVPGNYDIENTVDLLEFYRDRKRYYAIRGEDVQ